MRVAELGEIADFINGAAFKPSDWGEDGRRIIRIQNLNDPSKSFNRTTREVADKYLVSTGTLLVSWSASLGVYEWLEPDTALLNQHIFKVIPDRGKVDQGYLRHMLEKALLDMTKYHRGSTMIHVNRKEFLGTRIPLPALEEQKRIAGILDQAAELCRLRTRALAKLNTLGQAIFHEMFGRGLEPTSVQLLLDQEILLVHKDGNHGSNYPKKEEFGETGIPFLSAKAIDDGGKIIPEAVEYLNEEKARSLKIGWIKAGDVLLSHNASVGKVALYGGEFGEALIGTSLTCYRPNPKFLTSAFLEFALKSLDFQHQLSANMSQTTRNQVPITAQKRLTLQIPSLAAQIDFEDRTKALRNAAGSALAAMVKSETLFASLQHRAFRGELGNV